MEQWQKADRVQKNEETGEYRAFIGGQWVSAEKAQKNENTGEYRVVIAKPVQQPVKTPSGFMQGLRDPAFGAAQLVSNLIPDAIENRLVDFGDAAYKRFGLEVAPGRTIDEKVRNQEKEYLEGRKASGATGIDWARVGGNVANPLNLMVAAKIPAGASLLGKLGYGGLGGATMGAMQPATYETPENFASEKAAQVMMGALLGAGTQAATSAGSWLWNQAKATSRMLTPEGRKQLVYEAIRRWGGKNSDDIIQSLDDASPYPLGQYGPKRLDTLPDSPVTSADAIAAGNLRARQSNNPRVFGRELVEAQDKLTVNPQVSDNLASDIVKQEVARERAIAQIAGTDEAYARAVAAREKATAPLWQAVSKSKAKVDINDVNRKVNEYLSSKGNIDSIAVPLKTIKSKLFVGKNLETNVSKLEAVSQDIKNKMMQKTPGGQNEYDVKVLSEIKNMLDDAIGKAEPKYTQAREIYRTLSGPVNRMDVGRELRSKLTTSSGKESVQAFLSAADDATKTIKDATGFPRYKSYEQVLSPTEVDNFKRVAKELERVAEKTRILQKTPTMNVAREAEKEMVEAPRILEQSFVIANYFLGKTKERITPELSQMASDIVRDPQKLKYVLEAVPKSSRGELMVNIAKAAKLQRLAVPPAITVLEERKR